MTGWGGGGAFWGQDGEPAVGPIEVTGAAMTGDIEVIEHMLPLQIQQGVPIRSGLGGRRALARWLGHDPRNRTAGPLNPSGVSGRRNRPPPGVLGAEQPPDSEHIYRKFIVEAENSVQVRTGFVHQVQPGQLLRIYVPGGGGVESPLSRKPEAVLDDVRNGLVRVEEKPRTQLPGVSIDPDRAGTINDAETKVLRKSCKVAQATELNSGLKTFKRKSKRYAKTPVLDNKVELARMTSQAG